MPSSHSKDRSYHALHESAYQLPNSCVQQNVEKGVALCRRHNLHPRDHIQNDKQGIADWQLTAWLPKVLDLANKNWLQIGANLINKEGSEAVNCQSAMRCLSSCMWSVWCRLCRLHSATPFFNVLLNTRIRQLASIFMKRMVGAIF